MPLYTKKQMEKEFERRMSEADRWRWMEDRLERLGREISEVHDELWRLRQKVDPEFRAGLTPTCGSDCCTPGP